MLSLQNARQALQIVDSLTTDTCIQPMILNPSANKYTYCRLSGPLFNAKIILGGIVHSQEEGHNVEHLNQNEL